MEIIKEKVSNWLGYFKDYINYFQIVEQQKNVVYFSKFNLPKNFVEYFDGIKVEGIKNFEKLINEDSYYSEEDARDASKLILNMLAWDIDKRYSAEQCLNHPFFKEKENKNQ